MSARLYIISGAAGSGKSSLLHLIEEQAPFKAAISPKYSTRPKRKKEFDDIEHIKRINDKNYTFVYPMNNYIYGIKAGKIIDLLGQGYNVFIILSDLRIVEEVKQFFGSLAVNLYIYRNLSAAQLKKILEKRNKARRIKQENDVSFAKQRQTRLNRLYLMQRQYVDNITLFDHVILNTSKLQDMLQQVANLVEGYEKGVVRKDMKGPVIFLIAAASGAGKHTLMSAMRDLGRRSIRVIEKATAREVKYPPNGDNGKEIYQVKKIDPDKFDINYVFQNTEYGIETAKIWEDLSHGQPQILITNMQQFHKFREKFGPLIVCVYLHATRTRKQLFEWQARKYGVENAKIKVANLDRIHRDYVDNIAEFQHVLLNTLEKEDFWDQMFRLMKFYRDR